MASFSETRPNFEHFSKKAKNTILEKVSKGQADVGYTTRNV